MVRCIQGGLTKPSVGTLELIHHMQPKHGLDLQPIKRTIAIPMIQPLGLDWERHGLERVEITVLVNFAHGMAAQMGIFYTKGSLPFCGEDSKLVGV